MDITKMSRREFYKLPHRKWNEDIGGFDSLVILPAKTDVPGLLKYHIKRLGAKIFGLPEPSVYEIKHLHDSGWRCMDFVACRGNEPICRLSGWSDVLHIGGIAGKGSGWTIDCLPKSGLLRLFCREGRLRVGLAVSSFEVIPTEEEP